MGFTDEFYAKITTKWQGKSSAELKEMFTHYHWVIDLKDKYCLDKQKVIEAIEMHWKNIASKEKLLKELGLTQKEVPPTYCDGCSFKCAATECDCKCHHIMREYHAQKEVKTKSKDEYPAISKYFEDYKGSEQE